MSEPIISKLEGPNGIRVEEFIIGEMTGEIKSQLLLIFNYFSSGKEILNADDFDSFKRKIEECDTDDDEFLTQDELSVLSEDISKDNVKVEIDVLENFIINLFSMKKPQAPKQAETFTYQIKYQGYNDYQPYLNTAQQNPDLEEEELDETIKDNTITIQSYSGLIDAVKAKYKVTDIELASELAEIISKLNKIKTDEIDEAVDIVMPTEQPTNERIHVVKQGESLSKISKQYYKGITWSEISKGIALIKNANDLSSDTIHVGQKLLIPNVQDDVSQTQSNLYTVKKGDTLYKIAQEQYKLSNRNDILHGIKLIQDENNLTNDLIKIGQQLVIPPFKRTGYIVHEEQEQPITPMRPDTSNYYVNGYEVKRGDTLTSIAKIQYDIPPSTDTYSIVSEIKKLNPDKTKGSLRIGIMLILPEKTRDGCTLKQYNDTRIVEKEKIDYYNKKGVIIDNNNPKTYQDEEILNIISTFRSQKSKENHPDISDEYILECITKAAEAFSLDKKLLTLLIAQESAFNPTATSSCGAVGMCQLMLSTAQVDAFNALKKGLSREELQKLCPEGEINTKNLKDIRLNIMLGAAYLKKLLTMYNGDVELALIAYNWGMGHANKIKNKKSFKIPTETYGYVTNIVNNYKKSYTPVA